MAETSSSSWIPIPPDSDFSLRNIPFGVASLKPLPPPPQGSTATNPSTITSTSSTPFCCTAIGDSIIDLSLLEEAGLFHTHIPGFRPNTFRGATTLNPFLEQTRPIWTGVRNCLMEWLHIDCPTLRDNTALRTACIHDRRNVRMHLPVAIGDYTDFYSSREHATNVGRMFRPNDAPLQPNWLHLPVGYHGRSSTIVVSETPVVRPCGQLQRHPTDATQGSFYGPCQRLDLELEMAFYCGGPPNVMGQTLTMAQAKERIFGFSLLNDWSARDIQRWEYVPLGPFTSKNFCTTVSPWIITTMALEPFVAETSAGPQQVDPVPLPYLQDPDYSSYDIELTVGLQSRDMAQPVTICSSNFKHLYWNAAQQLVHHTVTGCVVRPGDLMASGTISGTTPNSFGSLLELSWSGQQPVALGDTGETRTFLQDGDTVVLHGVSRKEGTADRVGFGTCSGTILPAVPVSATIPASVVSSPPPPRFQDVTLYGYWRSSATWRVRTVLHAMGIPFTTIPIHLLKLENQSPEYKEKNPMGQLPTLECIDTSTTPPATIRLTQSVAIIEFLHETFPHATSLFPTDPVDRAVARQVVEMVNSGTQPLQNVAVLNRLAELTDEDKAKDFGKGSIERGIVALEAVVQQHRGKKGDAAGPYCLGTFAPTVADVFVVPQLYNARRFGVDVDTLCPTLVAMDALCAKHPCFEQSHPDRQPDAQQT